MKRAISLSVWLAAVLLAQSQKPNDSDTTVFYAATWETTLSASSGVLTIQLPAGANKRVYLQSANFWCSAACTITQERNGTAATATVLATVPLNTTGTPTAVVYSASNVGVGSGLPKIDLSAGNGSYADLSFSTFQKNSPTVQNYTLRTSVMTGTVRLSILWGER